MFAVYMVGCDGSYNPWDGAIYGPFDTVDEAKQFCDKDNKEMAGSDPTKPLRWIKDDWSKRINLSTEGYGESCYLIQELVKTQSLDNVEPLDG